MSEKTNNSPFDQGPIFIAKHQKKKCIPNLDKILTELESPENRERIKKELPKLHAEIDAVNQNRLEANMKVREWWDKKNPKALILILKKKLWN